MNDHEFACFARNFFESLGHFVAVDRDGKIVYASKQWAESMKITPEEALGQPLTSILSNTRLPELLNRSQETDFIPPENYVTASGKSIRRRLVIYEDGTRSKDNVDGAASFTILNAAHGETSRNETLEALSALLLQSKMYEEHPSELCSADHNPGEIIGPSLPTASMKNLIHKVAPSSVPVCIQGETGTGKELVANTIHKLSKRADKSFIKINCAAIPKDLMESELFGYEPGAFTGASKSGKPGKFELANGGTLLLDEIGELPLNLQAKLLRVIQFREVDRVGGTKPIPINVRLLFSTNRDLKQMVAEGTFRADLYYRINTLVVRVPSLRERRSDIPSLVSHFIEVNNERNRLSVTGISERAAAHLRSYHWPGNVRELENAIERACVLCGSGVLDLPHFSLYSSSSSFGAPVPDNVPLPHEAQPLSFPSRPLRLRDEETERLYIADALAACMGNRSAAAKQLGISRTTLYEKMKRYNLE